MKFRFAIRDIAWTIAFVGLLLAWSVDHFGQSRRLRSAEASVEALLTGQKVCRTILDQEAPGWQKRRGVPDLPTLDEIRKSWRER
jgi:hypothetical protein